MRTSSGLPESEYWALQKQGLTVYALSLLRMARRYPQPTGLPVIFSLEAAGLRLGTDHLARSGLSDPTALHPLESFLRFQAANARDRSGSLHNPVSNSRALLRAGNCGKPALPALLGRGVKLAGPSGYWVGHSSGSFAVGLLSVREPSLAARLPRIFHSCWLVTVRSASASSVRDHLCDGRKGEGDYQGVTSHAADRSLSLRTGRSASRVVAPWALFHPANITSTQRKARAPIHFGNLSALIRS